jgi:hypothetical protein
MPHFTLDFEKMYNSPFVCKVMGFIILKNFGEGFYKGIKNFKSSNRPVTQLFDNIVSYTVYGCFESLFWPLTFPLMITYELDKFANYIMGKPIRND